MLTQNNLLDLTMDGDKEEKKTESLGHTFRFASDGVGSLFVRAISGPIGNRHEFDDLITTLLLMGEDDEIIITLNTPGGSVWSMSQVAEAMDTCKGKVTCIAAGNVMSAGFILFPHCDKFEILDGAVFMAHGSSHGDFGKTADIIDRAINIQEALNQQLSKCVEMGMLTPEELERVVVKKGTIFISAAEMRSRLSATPVETADDDEYEDDDDHEEEHEEEEEYGDE